MSKTETSPKEGKTGSAEEGASQTSAEPNTQTDVLTKPAEGTEATKDSATTSDEVKAKVGDSVFSSEDKAASTQFKTVEDAEKSFKESQKYVDQLQHKVKELEAIHPVKPQNPEPGNKEVEVLKARLKMNEIFEDFATENPDFKGKMRTIAREIIETNIRAGQSIKMIEAYHMAKGKLISLGGSNAETQTEEELNAARIAGSGAPSKYKEDGTYQPNEKESEILMNLPLDAEGKKNVLERMKK